MMGTNYADELLGGGVGGGRGRSEPEPRGQVRAAGPEYGPEKIGPPSGWEDMSSAKPARDKVNPRTIYKASWASQPQTKIDLMAKNIFPDLPIEQSRNRMGVIDGDIVYFTDDGVPHKAIGEGAWNKFVATVPDYAGGGAPEILGGIAGAVSGGPWGAGLGAAAGKAVQQGVGALAFDEKVDWRNLRDIGIAFGLGIGGDLAGRGVNRAANRALRIGKGPLGKEVARDMGRIDFNDAKRLRAAGERWGLELTPPELANSPRMLEKVRALRGTGGGDVFHDWWMGKRYPQIQKAVNNFLDFLAPADDVAEAGGRAAMASRRAIGVDVPGAVKPGLAGVRQAKTGPMYKKALQENVDVGVDETIEYLNDSLSKTQPGPIQSALKRAQRALNPTGKELVDANGVKITPSTLPLENAQSAKKTFDSLISAAKSKGDRESARALTLVKQKLTDAMSKASPALREADAAYAELSKPITQAKGSVVGRLAKVEGDRARAVAKTIFGASSSPGGVSYARQMISSQDPGAWKALVRAHLQDAFQRISQSTATGDPRNIGAIWHQKVLGNINQKEMLKAALSPEQYQALVDFGDVMAATGRMMRGGSDTFEKQMIRDEIKSAAAGKAGVAASALDSRTYTGIGAKIKSWVERARTGPYSEDLMEKLLSPQGGAELSRIKQLPPGSRKALEATGVFLGLGGEAFYAAGKSGGPDYTPERWGRRK